MNTILCLENDKKWRDVISDALAGQIEVSFCHRRQELFKLLKSTNYDVIVLDLPDMGNEAVDLLSRVKTIMPYSPIIITSRTEKAEVVVAALTHGASEFIVKPYSTAKLRLVTEKVLENKSLKNEIDYLRRGQDVIYQFDKIIAICPAMVEVVKNLKKFAATDSTILMTGETGTGKSMLSGTVHYNSHRRQKPFIKINCANIQETLLESELFGHEKGAFTGADKLRIGRFEQANGGSIFLDEIGEMSLTLQAKLLRVLEDKSFERVGGNQTIFSDVRIIAATNMILEEKISAGELREDLYYRINVLPIKLPPLRERKECLEAIASFLLKKLSRTVRKNVTGFAPEVMKAIKTYSWPGNIRQLANTIERAMILEDGSVIHRENLQLTETRRPRGEAVELTAVPPPQENHYANHLAVNEKEQIIKALEKSLWIQKDAAAVLGISPRVMNHKIKKFGINHPRWRKNKKQAVAE